MRDYSVVVFALLLAFSLLSGGCGGSSFERVRGSSDVPQMPEAGYASDFHSNRILDLQGVLFEVCNYAAPAETDSEVFERLRKELISQLEKRIENEGRIVSQVPPGNTGKVTDLTLNAETGELTWSYMNAGDYDLSGEVGVPDITPIALNYLKKSTESELVAWIDGDANGEVGVPDVTPIAQNYLNTVQGYEFVTSDSISGPFVKIGEVIPFSQGKKPSAAAVLAPVKFAVNALPEGMKTYLWVRAVSSTGGAAMLSNRIEFTGEAPAISSVSPSGGITGALRMFTAIVTGDEPITYEWNFGGGASPDVSAEVAPEVRLGDVGTYSASLTVTNLFGSDTFDFNLNVTETGTPPSVTTIGPLSGTEGEQITITADIAGSRPLNSWSFAFLGGAATPTVVEGSGDPVQATVTLGPAGEYDCWFSVANDFGFIMSYVFFLTVEPAGGNSPAIIEVSPLTGAKDAFTIFSATVAGDSPFNYEWNFGGGASPNTPTGSGGSIVAGVTLGQPGNYDCSLYVENGFGGDWFYFTLGVTDGSPPKARLWAVPQRGAMTVIATLDPRRSVEENSGEFIMLYEIDFESDGIFDWSSPVPITVDHTYTGVGDHIATLRVTSSSGLFAEDTAPILVFETDPYAGAVDDSVFFHSTKSEYAAGEDILVGCFINLNANPLAYLNTVRFGVEKSKALATKIWIGEYFYGHTGTEFPSLLIPQNYFVDLGINYGGNSVEILNGIGLAGVIRFRAMTPGPVTFEVIGFDGNQDRTFYSSLAGTDYTFGTLGKDYGSGLTPVYTVNVN